MIRDICYAKDTLKSNLIGTITMLTLNQLKNMCRLQNEVNTLMVPGWLNAGNAWHRAAMNEIFEIYEHVSKWKWWKKMDVDLVQGQIELVDTFHFLLSDKIEANSGDVDAAAMAMFEELQLDAETIEFDGNIYHIDQLPFVEQLDLIIGLHAAKRTSLPLLSRLFRHCELSFDLLYYWYCSKNVLNTLRQHRGYKTGEYIKMWPTGNGNETLEDNVFMEKIANELDIADPAFPEKLYQKLDETYQSFSSQ